MKKEKRNRRYMVNSEGSGYKKHSSGKREETTLEKLVVSNVGEQRSPLMRFGEGQASRVSSLQAGDGGQQA